jgi:ABC-type sugar transport system permease subunit
MLVAPFVLVIFGFLLYPLGDALYLSLTHWRLLYQQNPVFVGPSTYRQLVEDSEFWGSLWRTCQWTVGTVAVEFVVGFPLALTLNYRTRLTGPATGLILLPWVTPTVVCAYAWVWVLNSQFGVVYAVLHALHLLSGASPLNSYTLALPTDTIVSGWKGVPFMAIAILATLKSIPAELHEAAQIDGATWLGRMLFITIPAVRKTALVVGMLLGIGAFYSFDFAWLMTNGGPGDATQLAAIYLFKTFEYDLNWGYAADIGMAMFVILAVAISFYMIIAKPYKE